MEDGIDVISSANRSIQDVEANRVDISRVSEATKEQTVGIDRVTTEVGEMGHIVNSTSDNAKQSSVAAGMMNTQANTMRSFVQALADLLGTQNHHSQE